MPVIFGQEMNKKRLLVIGGVIAAGVAVVVYLRYRAAQETPAGAPQPTDDQTAYGAGGGGPLSIPAGSDAAASSYQQQLDQADLQAKSIANAYQQNLVTQQQKQFDLEQRLQEMVLPEQAAAEAHYYKTVAKTKISCPGGQGLAQSPDGQLYCRQKTSGSWGPIPTGDIVRTVKGLIYGAEAAAPEIGYSASKQAAQAYLGQYLPSPTKKQKVVTGGTVPIAPAPHGYGELI